MEQSDNWLQIPNGGGGGHCNHGLSLCANILNDRLFLAILKSLTTQKCKHSSGFRINNRTSTYISIKELLTIVLNCAIINSAL